MTRLEKYVLIIAILYVSISMLQMLIAIRNSDAEYILQRFENKNVVRTNLNYIAASTRIETFNGALTLLPSRKHKLGQTTQRQLNYFQKQSQLSHLLYVTKTINNFNFSSNTTFVDGPYRYPDNKSPLKVKLSLPFDLQNVCSAQKQIIIIVITQPKDFDQRNIIRQTWATDKSSRTSIIFHVGQTNSSNNATKSVQVNAEVNAQVMKEAAIFGDLLVSDVIEDYYNLTLKTFGALLFVADHCQQATCIVKSDADTILNLRAIEKLCEQSKNATIFGYCFSGKAHRNPKSKWYVPAYVWHEEKYPTFCSGSAYVLAGANITTRLLSAANETSFYRSENFRSMGEDVVWTGIIAEKANIVRRSTNGFSPSRSLSYHCFEGGRKMPIAVHYVRGRKNIEFYWKIMKRIGNC